MNVFGEVAIKAVKIILNNNSGITIDPQKAWDNAVKEEKESMKKKGCPKETFLGLCYFGYIKGIKAEVGNHKKLSKNSSYGVEAIKMLCSKDCSPIKRDLWEKLQSKGAPKNENGQMDVVLALWNNNFISCGSDFKDNGS